jgi:hypothetical protein
MSGEIYAMKNAHVFSASSLIPNSDKHCRGDAANCLWKIEQETTSSNVRPAPNGKMNMEKTFVDKTAFASIFLILPLICYFLPSIDWSWFLCFFLFFLQGIKRYKNSSKINLPDYYLKSRIIGIWLFKIRMN